MSSPDFSRYHFKGQRESETILAVIHRHWFDIATHFILIVFFTGLLGATFFALPSVVSQSGMFSNLTVILFLQNTFLLLIWMYAFLVWIDYYFDVWIITNERIINIEQKGLFVRSVSELKFSRIQDVTSEVRGMIPTILNFGDVKIQTASDEDFFLFRQVPDPYHVKDVVMERLRTERDEEITKVVNASQGVPRPLPRPRSYGA